MSDNSARDGASEVRAQIAEHLRFLQELGVPGLSQRLIGRVLAATDIVHLHHD